MKIIVLGARGMLGKDLGRVFYDLNPYLLDKDELDIRDTEGVHKLFLNLKPDVVINAAAYTDVDGCEMNRELAMKVNGKAPGYIATAAKDVGAVFVHYSTDYVFDGSKAEGYGEDDAPGNPLNFYGESKLAGENAVRKAGGNYYLIRTSWLFGGWPSSAKASEGVPQNFVETMLRKASEIGGLTPVRGSDPQPIRVVNDQHGKPTCALDVARQTRALIEEKKDFGIYHIVNEPATTWYDFAKEILTAKEGQTLLGGSVPPSLTPCTSDEFPRPAKRPAYSILLNTKLPPMRSWQEALVEYMLSRK